MTLSDTSRLAILVTAVLQALGFLLLHEMIEADIWPLTDPSWRLGLYAIVVGVPLTLHLSIGVGRWPVLAMAATGLLILLGAMGAYAGQDLTGRQEDLWLIIRFILTGLVVVFPLLTFLQVGLEKGRWRFPYDRLYFHGWNNAIILQMVAVFLGIFWALLMVWAALFNLLDIAFFENLFTDRVFAYIASGLVGGYGLILARQHEQAVATVRRIVMILHKALLPLLTLITLVFVLALPFTGLEKLWDTGFAASLLLTVVALNVLFLSAVHADGEQPAPYRAWFRWLLIPSLLALPVYAGLAAYALYLRVSQYGWSEQRVLAALICLVLAGYALGYAVSLTRRQSKPWLPWLGRANAWVAVVIMAVGILINTPLLDPARVTVDNQLARLQHGVVEAEDFDYMALRFETGRYGQQALEELTNKQDHPQAETIRKLARTAQQTDSPWRWSDTAREQTGPEDWLAEIRRPDTAVDPSLLEWLDEQQEADWLGGCRQQDPQCRLVPIALQVGADEIQDDFLLVIDQSTEDWPYQEIWALAKQDGQWIRAGQFQTDFGSPPSFTNLDELIDAGDIRSTQPQWRRVQLGDEELILIDPVY